MSTKAVARILERSEHSVSRHNIDSGALKVLYRLDRSGHETYLVGGGVRDLLLGQTPKDYDVATSATPEEVRGLFRNSRIIGRRFRLVHVYFRQGIVEVSTFRAPPDPDAQRGGPDDLLVTDDNIYGTLREDAFRRDFTVNALYYRISDYAVVDHVGGVEDLERSLIRVIGDPDVRFREDPVRMLRACELAARLGFGIDGDAQESILRNRQELARGAPPRMREELLQILRSGAAGSALQWMLDLGVLEILAPEFLAIHEATVAGLGNFDRLIPVIDRSRPRRMDEVVLMAAVLAPLVLLARHRHESESRSVAPMPIRPMELVQGAIAAFAERLAFPNAKLRLTERALEILLRLREVPAGRWELRRVTQAPAFKEALQVFSLLTKATGKGEETLREWRRAMRDSGEIPAPERPPKRRRRRRRRRRSRQA